MRCRASAIFGGGIARAFGAMRERVPGGGGGVTRGVKVEVGERQAAVDLNVIIEYGVPIVDVTGDVRYVIGEVERIGLEVVEVNIAVDDVRLPTRRRRERSPKRVRAV
ncbi:Asp23/Gls24 family envelope stress response protein OS=Streptomyces alboniger OX=132473 GN=CP975_07735 PE=3 SV=1 [Streptomyces alboniger]